MIYMIITYAYILIFPTTKSRTYQYRHILDSAYRGHTDRYNHGSKQQ